MATRILLISQWFDPEPTFKGILFAQELVRQGFEIEVLTGFPNYPGGRVYSGYKIKWLQREVLNGIFVTRVPLYPSHNKSPLNRMLNYLSFAFPALFYGLFMAKRADVIYAYHPPLTIGIVASTLRIIRRIPVVYDIQDMWPDTLRATDMLKSPHALRLVSLVCDWVYRQVDHIVVLSPGFKSLLIERRVPSEKIEVIYNWADETALNFPKGNLPTNFPTDDRFRIMFAGNLGKAQALDTVLEAALILQKKNSNICFILLGDGVDIEHLKARTVEMQLKNIQFLPPVPMNEVGTYLSSADALLVHLRKDSLFEITIPSKIQAYMSVGKPILLAVEGDAKKLINDAECGLLCKSEDAQDLARTSEEFSQLTQDELSKFSLNGKLYYKSNLSLEVGVKRFAKIFSLVSQE